MWNVGEEGGIGNEFEKKKKKRMKKENKINIMNKQREKKQRELTWGINYFKRRKGKGKNGKKCWKDRNQELKK